MNYKTLAFILILTLIFALDVTAQCPMCRMAAESNLENGGTQARGLNNGILYMLSMPYILIGTLAIIWIRSRKKDSSFEME